MNKYIQQFLDDNDLQAGERFYILDKDYKKMFNKTFYINKNATGTDDILLDNNHFAIYSDTLLYLLTGIAFVKKKPFCPKYGEMVYYVTVSGYIQEVRFDTDSTLHQLLRKAGKLYRSEEEAKRYFNLTAFIWQSISGGLSFGVVIGAIVAYILKPKTPVSTIKSN